MKNFFLKYHKYIIIFLVLAVAVFLRFYCLSDYMTFLGDEGRDALVIKRILVEHDFPLLGAPTSVGDIYLGPLYYYMMAIPMAIFWLNPIAAAGMVALIGIATVFLIFYLGKSWFGFWPGITAAFLYAISPITIIASRSSWNPNPAPFFALLTILGFYKAHQTRNFLWLILSGGAGAAILQMHYLSLMLIPVLVLIWFSEVYLKARGVKDKRFILGTILALLVFCFLMAPLVIFDFRYNFMNYHALSNMFSGGGGSIKYSLLDNILKIIPIYKEKLIGRYLAGENQIISLALAFILMLPLALLLKNFSQKVDSWGIKVLSLWLFIGLLGLSFYNGPIYDHYLGFLNPVPYLLLAGVLNLLKTKKQIVVIILCFLLLGFLNLQKNPLLSPPNHQLQRTVKIAEFIKDSTKGEAFNFALISKNNYDSAYQFYLYILGNQPKVLPVEKTPQLFVVCEDSVCQPVGHPKYEIAGFGWSKIEWEKEAAGVKVFKLVPNPMYNGN